MSPTSTMTSAAFPSPGRWEGDGRGDRGEVRGGRGHLMRGHEPLIRVVRRLCRAVRPQDAPGVAAVRAVLEFVEEDLGDPVLVSLAGKPVVEEAGVVAGLAGFSDPGRLPAGLGQPDGLARPAGARQDLP